MKKTENKEKEKTPNSPKSATPKTNEPVTMSTADYNKELEEKKEGQRAGKNQ